MKKKPKEWKKVFFVCADKYGNNEDVQICTFTYRLGDGNQWRLNTFLTRKAAEAARKKIIKVLKGGMFDGRRKQKIALDNQTSLG